MDYLFTFQLMVFGVEKKKNVYEKQFIVYMYLTDLYLSYIKIHNNNNNNNNHNNNN